MSLLLRKAGDGGRANVISLTLRMDENCAKMVVCVHDLSELELSGSAFGNMSVSWGSLNGRELRC